MIAGLQNPGLDRVYAKYLKPEPKGPLSKEQLKLRELAPQMEGFFYGMLLKSMRASIPKNPYLNGGFAEDVFTGMLDEVMAEKAAERSGGFSIAKMIIKKFDSHVKAMSKPESDLTVPESLFE